MMAPVRSDILDSLQPADDARLLGSEWAAFREATKAERVKLGLSRKQLATAAVFRVCGGFRVIVASQNVPKPLLSGLVSKGAVASLVRKHGLTFAGAHSAVVMAAMKVLAPHLVHRLQTERLHDVPCLRCNCVFSASGPFAPWSEASRFIANEQPSRRAAA